MNIQQPFMEKNWKISFQTQGKNFKSVQTHKEYTL